MLPFFGQFLKGHCREGKSIMHNAISAVKKIRGKKPGLILPILMILSSKISIKNFL